MNPAATTRRTPLRSKQLARQNLTDHKAPSRRLRRAMANANRVEKARYATALDLVEALDAAHG